MQQTHHELSELSALQPSAASKAVAGSMQQAPEHGLLSSPGMDAAETAPADAPQLPLTEAFIAEQPSSGASERVCSEGPAIGRTSSIAGKHIVSLGLGSTLLQCSAVNADSQLLPVQCKPLV